MSDVRHTQSQTSSVLTSPDVDFPRWYQDVLTKAELAENGPSRGSMVIRPYAYAIWELIQSEIDRRIKSAGAQNAYFPLLIPQSYIDRESEHVEGFSPELAIVEHAGGKALDEPLVVRPTSETVIGEYMSRWVQSYRDLPLLLNQWCNVLRWEMRPRLFIRTSEFLWQEGHTAHATHGAAIAYTLKIHMDVYRDFLMNELALPVFIGRKTPRERFAGALTTLTCEGMMGDGKALQLATSHDLGQNFARSFDIRYLDRDGSHQLAWTTSWGSSTRLLGGLIMGHGDAHGLRLPPRLAPTQVVVIPVRSDDDVVQQRCHEIVDRMRANGQRVAIDRAAGGFGRRVTDWEVKGVPLRIEVGPRDVSRDEVTIARRDTGQKQTVGMEQLPTVVPALLTDIQTELCSQALQRRDDRTMAVECIDDAAEAARTGFATAPWSMIGEEGESKLADQGMSVRCLQRPDGTIPESDDERELIAVIGRAY
ncbi:proline--tRNA ligase [Phytoactinopolyspora endophytica]|uniref:proline--tRNA ligase n=1 Tax=Phytoactinopolyspora endophytica TaxID=1642495 RepID=UPI00197C8CED|nr:proline--tRNA ligase [Phytoactinopolyspora endophytica]